MRQRQTDRQIDRQRMSCGRKQRGDRDDEEERSS